MNTLSRVASAVAGLLVLVLVAITAASVVTRYVFAAPFQWTEELSGLLMIWIVLLGAIGCEFHREHLTIDVVMSSLPDRLRNMIALGVGFLSLGLLIAMSWLGWELARSAITKQTRLLGISWFWIDIAVVVGAAGIAIVLLARLIAALTGREKFEDESVINLVMTEAHATGADK